MGRGCRFLFQRRTVGVGVHRMEARLERRRAEIHDNHQRTYANEFDLDYDVDDEMKVKTTVDWANKATADIIGDLRTFVKLAKDNKLNPKFAFVNLDEFYKIASADQIIKACASFAANALGISQTPDLTQVNAMLAKQAWLNGIQLRIIDQTITREFTDGSQTSGNPFENCRLVLSETETPRNDAV